jgi:predicted phosphodiesterase
MRYLFLADIHSNSDALEAVLADALGRGFDEAVFLGDAVGYGADPVGVLQLLEAMEPLCIMGNHDEMLLEIAAGKSVRASSPVGIALKHNATQLESAQLEWIRSWTKRGGTRIDGAEALFIHGSPRDPDEYVDSVSVARSVFADWSGRMAFVGHSHIAGVYSVLHNNPNVATFHACMDAENRLTIPPKGRWIVNPGSVGQPRDGNTKASYGIYNIKTATLEIYRVHYDIAAAQEKIRMAGFPEALAARLGVGK